MPFCDTSADLTLRLRTSAGTPLVCRLVRFGRGERLCSEWGSRDVEYSNTERAVQFYDASRRCANDPWGLPIARRSLDSLVLETEGRRKGTFKVCNYRRRDNGHGFPALRVMRLDESEFDKLLDWLDSAEEIAALVARAMDFSPLKHPLGRPSALAAA